MDAEGLNFSESDLSEVYKKYTNTLWNVFTFYQLFAKDVAVDTLPTAPSQHVLDQWILAQLANCLADVTTGFEQYNMRQTALPLVQFVQELSTWYVRRCRGRMKGTDESDRLAALATLRTVLLTFVKIAAPVTPFLTEHLYQALRAQADPVSVHHCDWPVPQTAPDAQLLETMADVRDVIQQALALRAAAGLKVRQPLTSVTIPGEPLDPAYEHILCEELNVKQVFYGKELVLDMELTDELRQEGQLREFVRQVNAIRKKLKLSLQDILPLQIQTNDSQLQTLIQHHGAHLTRQVLASTVELVDAVQPYEFKIDTSTVTINFVQ